MEMGAPNAILDLMNFGALHILGAGGGGYGMVWYALRYREWLAGRPLTLPVFRAGVRGQLAATLGCCTPGSGGGGGGLLLRGGGGGCGAGFGEAKFGEGESLVQNLKYRGKMWCKLSE